MKQRLGIYLMMTINQQTWVWHVHPTHGKKVLKTYQQHQLVHQCNCNLICLLQWLHRCLLEWPKRLLNLNKLLKLVSPIPAHRAPLLNQRIQILFKEKCFLYRILYFMYMYIFFLLCYQVESFNLYAHCEQFPYIIPNGMFGVQSTQGIQIYPKHNLLSTIE